MAHNQRPRFVSESSTSSSDSYCLDVSGDRDYEEVRRGSDEVLIQQKPSHKTKAGNSSSSKIAVAALVLSIVCLLVILSCGGFLGYAYVFKSPFGLPAASKNEEVCMPCDQISPNPLEEAESPTLQQLEIEDGALDGESKICCARTPAQYAALFKLILKRQEEVKKLADVLGSRGKDIDGEFGGGSSVGSPAVSAVSAHLLTKPMVPQFTDEDGNVLQQWKSPSESPVSHVRQGLKFHDSKIYVQSAGLYFVYCQILYNRATGDHHNYPALASNYVKRHSVLYPASSGILLKARHTRMSGENDRHSSYVGGLFFLHAGDQLFVQVAVPELVSHDDKASFFGLFKVFRRSAETTANFGNQLRTQSDKSIFDINPSVWAVCIRKKKKQCRKCTKFARRTSQITLERRLSWKHIAITISLYLYIRCKENFVTRTIA